MFRDQFGIALARRADALGRAAMEGDLVE